MRREEATIRLRGGDRKAIRASSWLRTQSLPVEAEADLRGAKNLRIDSTPTCPPPTSTSAPIPLLTSREISGKVDLLLMAIAISE